MTEPVRNITLEILSQDIVVSSRAVSHNAQCAHEGAKK